MLLDQTSLEKTGDQRTQDRGSYSESLSDAVDTSSLVPLDMEQDSRLQGCEIERLERVSIIAMQTEHDL